MDLPQTPEITVPDQVAHQLLERALHAQLQVPRGSDGAPLAAPQAPGGESPGASGALIVALAVAAALLVVGRRLRRSGRRAKSGPAVEPDAHSDADAPDAGGEAPHRAAGGGRRQAPARREAPRRTVALPPHVAEMMARIEARSAAARAQEGGASAPPAVDGADERDPPAPGSATPLDVWVAD